MEFFRVYRGFFLPANRLAVVLSFEKIFLGGFWGVFEKNGGQKGVKTGFFQILFFSIGIWFSCMGNTIKSVLSRFGPILTEFLPKNGVWKAGVQNLGVPPNSKGRKKFFSRSISSKI